MPLKNYAPLEKLRTPYVLYLANTKHNLKLYHQKQFINIIPLIQQSIIMKYFIFLFLALTTFSATAQELPKNFNQIVQDIEPQIIKWRRHFHENPELSNREFNTSKYIADYLKTLGIEVHYPVAKTGVVAIL